LIELDNKQRTKNQTKEGNLKGVKLEGKEEWKEASEMGETSRNPKLHYVYRRRKNKTSGCAKKTDREVVFPRCLSPAAKL